MKKDEIASLLQRFLEAGKKGAEPYFDASEIDAMLEEFEQTEDYTHYEALLKLGLKLHPRSPDLKIRECKYLLYTEDYQRAMELVEGIADRDDFDCDTIRLECYSTMGQFPRAMELINRRTAENCDYLEDLFEFISPLLSDMEMTYEARELTTRGLQLFPDNIVLIDELCYIYELEGNFEQAIRVCNELIDREPYSYDYWFTLGRLFSLSNDFNSAIEAFDFALTCDNSPDNELKMLKAYCLYMNESYQKALEVYAEILNDEPSNLRVKYLMGECNIRMGEFEEAYHKLKEVVFNPGAEASAYVSFIRCCAETGREDEGVKRLREASLLFPGNLRIQSLFAVHLLESGDGEMAMKIVTRILEQLESMRRRNSCKNNDELLDDSDNNNNDDDEISEEELGEITKYYKNIFSSQIQPFDADRNISYISNEELTKAYLKNNNNNN
jgi:tetratricopeptide (TPR) repeat protein